MEPDQPTGRIDDVIEQWHRMLRGKDIPNPLADHRRRRMEALADMCEDETFMLFEGHDAGDEDPNAWSDDA